MKLAIATMDEAWLAAARAPARPVRQAGAVSATTRAIALMDKAFEEAPWPDVMAASARMHHEKQVYRALMHMAELESRF